MGLRRRVDVGCLDPDTKLLATWLAGPRDRIDAGDFITDLASRLRNRVERGDGDVARELIGGLPVVEADHVIDVITETDIFRVFVLLLGAHEPGIRMTATAIDRPGLLADLTGATARAGGDITAIVTYPADDGSKAAVFLKVKGVSMEQLTAALSPFVEGIDEIREAGGG